MQRTFEDTSMATDMLKYCCAQYQNILRQFLKKTPGQLEFPALIEKSNYGISKLSKECTCLNDH
jgi:hypothetical protein